MTDLFQRFRAARHRALTQRRFRDPMRDFDLSEDRVQAFSAQQPAGTVNGPYLFEQANYVSLHLAGDPVQGVQALMDRQAPERLVLLYTAIMAGFTRFCDSPRTIGMIGLGGGSLAKHCYQAFPASRIFVAENNTDVIAMRRDFFIPDDDARFRVIHADGAEFVSEHAEDFDVLLIDAFDERGYPPHLATRDFYRDCYHSLSKAGVLVINFSGAEWASWFWQLDAVFRQRTVLYQCPDGDNVLAFATKGALPDWIRS